MKKTQHAGFPSSVFEYSHEEGPQGMFSRPVSDPAGRSYEMSRLTALSRNPEENLSEKFFLLLLAAFFFRLLPAILFLGSSEVTQSLHSPEATNPPLLPLFHFLYPLQNLTGIPCSFWLKFPGILADVGITGMICFATFQFLQDRDKALVTGLFYALNPLSIFITSFAGSTVSVSLALLLASFLCSRVSRNLILSAVLYGTAVATNGLCLVFLPVLLLKSGGRWVTRLFFLSFVFLTSAAWILPPFLHGRKVSLFGCMMNRDSGEPLLGIYNASQFLSQQAISQPLKNFLVSSLPLSHTLIHFLAAKGFFFFLGGLLLISIFHKKYNTCYFSSIALAWAFIVLPGLKPSHWLWALPFFLLSSCRTAIFLSLGASLFLVGRYSLMRVESGTFCASAFLYHPLTNAYLYRKEWLYWIFLIAGVLILVIFFLFLIKSLLFTFGMADHLKEKPIHPKNVFLIGLLTGVWIIAGGVMSLGRSPGRDQQKQSSHLNNALTSATGQYGQTFYYRNRFRMESNVEPTILRVSSENFLNIFLNGKRLFSEPADFFHHSNKETAKGRKRGIDVELTPYLTKGENVIGIESHHTLTRPFTGIAVSLHMKDERRERFSLPFFRGWRSTLRQADARWITPGFDDSSWAPPVIINGLEAGEAAHSHGRAPASGKTGPSWESFYMLPKSYAPPVSPISAPLLFIIYSFISCILFLKTEKKLHFAYAFFENGSA